MLLPILFIVAAIAADQYVKMLALEKLSRVGTYPILDNIFHLTYVENRGAAFGMMQDARWFLIGTTLLAVALIGYALYRGWLDTALGRWSAYFVLAGALGNLIDRAMRGFVVDMFDFRLINFAVFNVADVFVSVGGAMFVLFVLIAWRREHKAGHTHDQNAADRS